MSNSKEGKGKMSKEKNEKSFPPKTISIPYGLIETIDADIEKMETTNCYKIGVYDLGILKGVKHIRNAIKRSAIPPLPETKKEGDSRINQEWAEWVDSYKGVWVPKDGYPKGMEKGKNIPKGERVTPEEWEEKWKKKWENLLGEMTPSFFKQKFRNEYLQEGFVVKEEEDEPHSKEAQPPSPWGPKLWGLISSWVNSWNKRIKVTHFVKKR